MKFNVSGRLRIHLIGRSLSSFNNNVFGMISFGSTLVFYWDLRGNFQDGYCVTWNLKNNWDWKLPSYNFNFWFMKCKKREIYERNSSCERNINIKVVRNENLPLVIFTRLISLVCIYKGFLPNAKAFVIAPRRVSTIMRSLWFSNMIFIFSHLSFIIKLILPYLWNAIRSCAYFVTKMITYEQQILDTFFDKERAHLQSKEDRPGKFLLFDVDVELKSWEEIPSSPPRIMRRMIFSKSFSFSF